MTGREILRLLAALSLSALGGWLAAWAWFVTKPVQPQRHPLDLKGP